MGERNEVSSSSGCFCFSRIECIVPTKGAAMDNGFAEWGGYMDAKITKLEEQFSAASNPFKKTDLFAGISIYVNGHTKLKV
ncbi:hypothetical protein DOY81_014701 [Sarcophaga bullata]|nr:hypothetical protein DOY81_014701 [Sarcophaga bullata]